MPVTSQRAWVLGSRLAIGLAQGAALYLLYFAYDKHMWPATTGAIFAPLSVVTLFIPLLVIHALGNLRTRTSIIWAAIATILVAALTFYDNWRAWPVDWDYALAGGSWRPHVLPSFEFLAAIAAALFVTHALVASGDVDRKLIADYPRHFDIAWQQGVQLALSAAFVGAFWILLELGAGLFELVDISFLNKLYRHEWFWIPVTALAVATALHITDTHVGLIRGARILALTLLSLLLPLITLIVSGFLIALIFTGLEPLWSTRHASTLLLATTATIVALINTAYQDGEGARSISPLLRYPGSLAALLPLPLVVLTGYALALRVGQYGWTVDRIFAAGAVLVAACYALGYARAVLTSGPWLKRIERCNFYAALTALAVFLALFSPIADPARIAVDSQMARLDVGQIADEKLDFRFLRWDGGRFGKTALEKLAAREDAKDAPLHSGAQGWLESKTRYARIIAPHAVMTNLSIHTPDGTLPDSFVKQSWSGTQIGIPACLTEAQGTKCDIFMKDVRGTGSPQILVLQYLMLTGFEQDESGIWHAFGQWGTGCGGPVLKELQDGNFTIVPPTPKPVPDIEVLGLHLRFAEMAGAQSCPK